MDNSDKKSTVQEEQFSTPENGTENTNGEANTHEEDSKSHEKNYSPENERKEDLKPDEQQELKNNDDVASGESKPELTKADSLKKETQSHSTENSGEKEEITANEENPTEIKDADTSKVENIDSNDDESEKESSKDDDNQDQQSEETEEEVEEEVDFSEFSKEQLIEELDKIITKEYKPQNRDIVDDIKKKFYEIRNNEVETIKQKFLDDGGIIEDFKPEEDPLEEKLKGYVIRHKERKTAYYQQQEENKKNNLEEKYRIIDEIESLINKEESLNQTFQEFNELQRRWKEAGLVPQQNLKELWDKYHYTIEKFYDYIKINKELRDLDFKKNQEAKIVLCEKAEELLLEPNIVNAFRVLQTLHDQWREIGPVPQNMRNVLWERFKEATSKINKKHQEYFHNLKEEQKKNLEQKTLLCEKAEEITALEITTLREWDKKADELKELQKIWKTIGFAPKKDNNAIYERFRKACDNFFERKRDYFAKNREEQNNNLQLKIELCAQAESVKDSDDWRKTTDELIALQKKWKTIGPVPRKHSDAVWKRFRAACDAFFNRKSDHFANIDTEYEENLKKKETLIEEILALNTNEKPEEALSKLKDFQRQWTEIGYVPIKQKDEIQKKFREAINTKFDELELDEQKKNMIKFRSKVDDMVQGPKGYTRLRQDREKLINKLKQIENDIVLWENNIGFFANSKNAQSMINDVERKIADAKKKMEGLKEKIRLIEDKLDE